jgi:AraC family transcriptional regulator of arabinose operon
MRTMLSGIDVARVSVGEVAYPAGGRLGPRLQRDVQLVLVHTGRATIAIDGGPPATHPAGSVALLLPGHTEVFAFAREETTRHSWVQAGLEPPPEALLARLAGLPRSLPSASPELTGLVREAVAAARTPLSSAEPLVAALAVAALWQYVGEAESPLAGSRDVVARARAFLHAHVDDPGVDLAAVARAVHVSPAHLVRRFRGEVGVTPMAYLWRRRVAAGIDLLVNSGLPVGEVAARAGFKSVYHFSRRVKDQTGASPTQVRRNGWRL